MEELTLMRDAIMFPYMLTMCDKSLQDLRNSSHLFKQIFEQIIQFIIVLLKICLRSTANYGNGISKCIATKLMMGLFFIVMFVGVMMTGLELLGKYYARRSAYDF